MISGNPKLKQSVMTTVNIFGVLEEKKCMLTSANVRQGFVNAQIEFLEHLLEFLFVIKLHSFLHTVIIKSLAFFFKAMFP